MVGLPISMQNKWELPSRDRYTFSSSVLPFHHLLVCLFPLTSYSLSFQARSVEGSRELALLCMGHQGLLRLVPHHHRAQSFGLEPDSGLGCDQHKEAAEPGLADGESILKHNLA